MTIFKMFDGRHIDLSKIAAVGPMVTKDKFGFDAYPWHFLVWFQLMDKPLQFQRPDLDEREIQRAYRAGTEARETAKAAGKTKEEQDQAYSGAEWTIRGAEICRCDREFSEGYNSLMSAWRAAVDKKPKVLPNPTWQSGKPTLPTLILSAMQFLGASEASPVSPKNVRETLLRNFGVRSDGMNQNVNSVMWRMAQRGDISKHESLALYFLQEAG